MTQPGKKNLQEKMYPKVKVRVQREDAEHYAYEKTSLQSLKAFEWLSVNDSSSSDDSPKPVARIPRSYIPRSPPPSFYRSKEETNKQSADVKENQESVGATSAPRPRAVLSSPDNDEIIRSRTEARKQPSSILKNRYPNHNRHTQCKIFPKSTAADEVPTPKKADAKESPEVKNDVLQPKGRVTALADSRTRAAAQLKKMVPSWVQR